MNTAILRSRILDLAIRGQLVPQDPNEGTADDLLKAIATQRGKPVTPITDNVPFSIPDNWCWVKLGDIAESVLYGVSASAQKEGKYKLLRITDIQDNKVNWDTVPYTDFALRDIEKYYLQMGDIVFARTGATVGKSYLIEDELKDVIFASYLIRVRLIDVFNKYVISFFNSYEYWRQITQYSVGIGQPNCNGTSLKNLLIPLPPLPEQRRIVAKVEELLSEVETIEHAQTDITHAATILRSRVLDMAISGKLTNSNTEEWESMTLGNVCSFQNGYAFDSHDYCKEGIPLIRIGDIQAGHVTFDKCVYVKKNVDDVFLVQKGDLLIAMSGASTGKIGIYEEDRKAYLNQRVGNIRVKDNSKIISQYRDLFLKSQSETIYKLAYGGAQPNISGKMILSLPLNLPPLSEQRRIVAKVEELFAEIDKLIN